MTDIEARFADLAAHSREMKAEMERAGYQVKERTREAHHVTVTLRAGRSVVWRFETSSTAGRHFAMSRAHEAWTEHRAEVLV